MRRQFDDPLTPRERAILRRTDICVVGAALVLALVLYLAGVR
jgi:hypothetical protein